MINLTKLWQARETMPVITVSRIHGRVLMHGYMDKRAFAYSLKTGKVWYLNPQTGEVKMHGVDDGNVQKLISIKADSELETLLVTVEQIGHVLHKDNKKFRTAFINDVYGTEDDDISKHRKFGKVEIDENFDYSKEDYDDFYE